MPALICQLTGRRAVLGRRCIVGRGPAVGLRLSTATVSAEHASIYYSEGAWKVRDLGSRNGTFLNGQRVGPRGAGPLTAGDLVAFGGPAEPGWVLEAAHGPGPAARVSSGAWVVGDGCRLWLPSDEEPEVCVQREGGHWILEGAESSSLAHDGARIVVGSESYVLELPATSEEEHGMDSTVEASSLAEPELSFGASQDEEHVHLEARMAGRGVSLGARAYNYALLLLARRRLQERQQGIKEGECGWYYAQELREKLGLDRPALNLQLWRATQSFKKAGLHPEKLIERRADSQQLRIGFADLVLRGVGVNDDG